ncbi:MAG: carboxylesterase family protein [Candidatus Limimorpha sp.]
MLKVYKGIRYARAERFKHAVIEPELKSLDDVVCEPKICPQNKSLLDNIIGDTESDFEQSEDCLRLSVFVPEEGSPIKPVLVWIHGGAFLTESGVYERYDASQLSESGDIIVVNVSYRLGVLGFLYEPEKDIINLGVADQICALRWVKKNIHLFGGDADNVTIFGQSAGAYSVLTLISCVKEILFSKAIVASAPFLVATKKKMSATTRDFLSLLPDDASSCSLDTLLSAQQKMLEKSHGGMPFMPVCDDIKTPSNIPCGLKSVMLWCQKDDALPFVPFRFMTKIATKMIFELPMRRYVKYLNNNGVDSSCCVLDWRHGESTFGAVHCMELPLLFGTYELWRKSPFMDGVSLEEYNIESEKIREKVIGFVKS